MLRFQSGHSKSVNTSKAVAECLKCAGVNADNLPDLIIVHSTLGHKLEQMLSELNASVPSAKVVGCTGTGVVGAGWVSEAKRAMAIMVVSGGAVATASMRGIRADNSGETAGYCAHDLNSQNSGINMIIAFGPGLAVDGGAIITGIESVFGPDVPILGGLAGFMPSLPSSVPRTPVFHGEKVIDDGLVLIGINAPNFEVIQKSHHGSRPQHDQFVVTKSDGVRVDEFNGRPAWPTLMKSLNLPADTMPSNVINLIGLGLSLEDAEQTEYDNGKILRAPLSVDENFSSCYLQVSAPKGTVFTSCQRDEDYMFSGLSRLMERMKESLGERTPLAIFHTDCTGRGRMSNNVIAKDGIIKEMQESLSTDRSLPWLGLYGFAEFGKLNGRNRHHNYTTTLSAIVQKDDVEKV